MHSHHRRRLIAMGLISTSLTASALAVSATAEAATPTTTRASVSPAGVEGDGASYRPSISADGQFVAFQSAADNLIALDHPGHDEIFVRDTVNNDMQRITVPTVGEEADGDSFAPAISADGRFVTYSSYATNLVANDTNGVPDVFVYDRINGGTRRVSVGLSGSGSSGGGSEASISSDGSKVAFSSTATDIVAGDTNKATDVFVRNLNTGKTIRASLGPNGIQSDPTLPPPAPHDGGRRDNEQPMISADGNSVVFTSYATNLVRNDTNKRGDVFVRDLKANVTTRVSVKPGGGQSTAGPSTDVGSFEPSISANGQIVTFGSDEKDLTSTPPLAANERYVYNRGTGVTTFAEVTRSGGPGALGASDAEISPDGRYVTFTSQDSTVVTGDTNGVPDIFLRDLQTNATRRVSVSTAGVEANGASNSGTATPGGTAVAVTSVATNLVADDTNNNPDVFVRKS
jgi:hypothetical protein